MSLTNPVDPNMPTTTLLCDHCGKEFYGRVALTRHKAEVAKSPEEGDAERSVPVPVELGIEMPEGELLSNADLVELEKVLRKIAPKNDRPVGIFNAKKRVGSIRPTQIADIVHELLLRRLQVGFDIPEADEAAAE